MTPTPIYTVSGIVNADLLRVRRLGLVGSHLDCITPVRFGVGGADKGATEYREPMSDQLTVFSRGAFVTVYKG